MLIKSSKMLLFRVSLVVSKFVISRTAVAAAWVGARLVSKPSKGAKLGEAVHDVSPEAERKDAAAVVGVAEVAFISRFTV